MSDQAKQDSSPKKPSSDETSNSRQANDDNSSDQPRIGRVKGLGPVKKGSGNRQNQDSNNNNSDGQQGDRARSSNKRRKNNNNNNRNRSNNKNRRDRRDNNRERKPIVLTGDPVDINGMLELAPKGFGFLRVPGKNYAQCKEDVFVPPDFIRKHGLRAGVWIHGKCQDGPRGPQLTEITAVNDLSPEDAFKLPHFEELKAINPNRRIAFETTPERFTTRVLDIVSPVGRGQRGLIVSPPRSGKTTLLLHMAEAIKEKYRFSTYGDAMLII